MVRRGSYRIIGVRNRHLQNIIGTFNMTKEYQMTDPNFMKISKSFKEGVNQATGKQAFDNNDSLLSFAYGVDVPYPLETVEFHYSNHNTNKNLIHPPMSYMVQTSSEFAFNMNMRTSMLLADFYFYGNKANATSKKSHILPTHEVAHTAQIIDKDFTAEPDREVDIWADDSDPKEMVTIAGKNYWLRKSEQKRLIHELADDIKRWMEEQKIILDERDYFKLLVRYKEMVTCFHPIYETKTEADRWMEQELKKELRSRCHI